MRIGELRRVLRQSGVLGEAGGEPAPAELADALWLAALRRAGRPAPPAAGDGPSGTGHSGAPEELAPKHLPKRSLLPSASWPGSPLSGSQVHAALPVRGTAAPGVLVSVAGQPQLPEALSLARAMRPLRRRVPSATRHVLDEEGTADLRAEQQLWLPALIPDNEPAFDLALVLDDSESMALWGEKVREFRLLCERIGAFRDVRLWRLGARGGGSQARPVLRSSRSACTHNERELVDLSGRRLILVITDGVHPWWRSSGPLLPVLARWALTSPLAIVQPFPQRLWSRSPLRPVTGEFRPGWPGNGPTIARRTRNGRADGTRSPGSVAVPVLELSPAALRRWAGIISGASGVTPLPAATLPRESTVQEEPHGNSGYGNGGSRDRTDPARLVREFRAAVSPAAYQLAGYLSAAPLTLPVMRLVQESMMPGTGPAELAEVFLSGLLLKSAGTEPLADPERASYVFTAGVRDVLQSTLTRSEALSVLDQVGRYLTGGRRGGRPFPVFLYGQPDGSGILAAAEQFPASFGRISGMLLERIGASHLAVPELTRPEAAVPAQPEEEAAPGAPPPLLPDVTRERQEGRSTGRPQGQMPPVVRPLIQHSVLFRVAGALDERHRSDENLPAARVVDVMTLVAAIVCGGEKVLVDPTVPDQTMDRTRESAGVLGLEVALERPPTSDIAKVAQHGGNMLTVKSAVEVKLAPVKLAPGLSSGSYPRNGPELTSGHLDLAKRLADDVGESGRNVLTEEAWGQLARRLCESGNDRFWGNKLLAGLCSRDARAAGQGESATAQYLADLRRVAPGWEATPQAYWMTNARISKFRSGFLPGIAREMGGMYYGQSTEDGISDRVEFFDRLADEMLARRGERLPDSGALADTAATRALAWAAVKPILDPSWNRRNPRGLIEAAKNYAGGDASDLMREAHRIGLGEPAEDNLIERLSSDPDELVDPRRPRSVKSLALALSIPTVGGAIAYFSPYVTQSLEHFANPDGLVELGGVAATGTVQFGIDRARRRRRKYDVSAANIFLEFLNDETRRKVERKLSSELGITP